MAKSFKDITDTELRAMINAALDSEQQLLSIANILKRDFVDESSDVFAELTDLAHKSQSFATWLCRELLARGAHLHPET